MAEIDNPRVQLEIRLRAIVGDDDAVDCAMAVLDAGWVSPAEIEQYRGIAAECTALAEALAAVTHEFRPRMPGSTACADGLDVYPAPCAMGRDHHIHQTPAAVRRRRLTQQEG